jgi:hypothetical protein
MAVAHRFPGRRVGGVQASAPGSRRRWREIVFSATRYRVIWGAIAIVPAVGGFFLIRPVLGGAPAPPHTWGLYLTTDSLDRHPRRAPADWLLKLRIKEPDHCGQPALAYGELEPDDATKLDHLPRFISLGVAGAVISSPQIGRVRVPGGTHSELRWRPMRLARFRHGYVATAKIPRGWHSEGEDRTFLRFSVAASGGAGYGSCYLTSPALFEYPGEDQRWYTAQSLTNIYLRQRRLPRRLEYAPLTDAILYMSAAGKTPDRAATDAGALVRGDSLLLTCSGEVPDRPRRERADAFYYERILLGESSCASVQTFRASDAVESSNLRLFFAGVLLSAAVAMLLEAVVTGRTGELASDAPLARGRDSSEAPQP